MRSARNAHLPAITVAEAEANIVAYCKQHGFTRYDSLTSMSSLGYAAFPTRSFGKPQGAALAVAKIVSGMVKRKELRWHCYEQGRFKDWGYYLTLEGPT